MSHNFLSPGFVKIRYTGPSGTHFQTLPVNPTGEYSPGSEPNFDPKVGSPVAMSTAVDAYIALAKVDFGASVTFVSADYWQQPTPEDDPVWIFTHPLGVAGTAGTDSSPARQSVMSFRTSLGGIFFWYGVDCTAAIAATLRDSYPFARGSSKAIADYLMSNDSWVLGRDNGTLAAAIWQTGKVNDALRKRFYNL